MATSSARILGQLAFFAIAIATAGLTAQPARAQTAPPSPAPSTPQAFAARAHADVAVVAQDKTMTGSAQFAVAQRDRLIRIDLLSIKSDTMPIPPIRVTVVIDRGANTISAWSDATKLYHVQAFLPRSTPKPGASPKPSASPKARASSPPAPLGASPFSKLDVLALTVKLTGHTTTAGVPTTGLSFDLQVAKKGDSVPMHVTATSQLADEYAAFPMTLDVSLEPGGTAPVQGKLGYAVDELTHDLPPLTRFAIPRGYADAGSLLGVIFPRPSK
jgi:hypothetical protein